jgi:Ca2+:H+ antiporter
VALVAIIPLAGRIGTYTDVLETYLGERLGGLVSAAFGNIPEITLGLALLLQARLRASDPAARGDALDILHSLLIGSVINNLLFTLGVAFLPAALLRGRMRFDTSSAAYFISALGLAVIGLSLPTIATAAAGTDGAQLPLALTAPFSLILILSYGAYLAFTVFGLRTGRAALAAPAPAAAQAAQEDAAETAAADLQRRERAALRRAHPRAVGRALLGLSVVSLATAAIAGVLVNTSERVILDTPLTPLSVGFILFPIVCNLGEQAGAVTEARQGKAQEALSIAAGSSVQVAFFVAPLLALVSFPLGGFAPALTFTLTFAPAQLLLLLFAIFIFALVTLDGETNWLHGLQMLALYAMITLVAFALPGR